LSATKNLKESALKLPLLLQHIGNPSEIRDRVRIAFEVRREKRLAVSPYYEMVSVSTAFEILEEALGKKLRTFLAEASLLELESQVSAAQQRLKLAAPFSLKHNGDVQLAHFCYALSRATSPNVVLETGVAYGVTSAYLLQSLELNGRGSLWSIDLPPLGHSADDYVGFLIPPVLKTRWRLQRGSTRRVLPKLLPELDTVDMFIQDSLHTYQTVMDEIVAVWPRLRPGGVLIADDVGRNCAFKDFATRTDHAGSVVVQESSKNSTFGIILKKPFSPVTRNA
jgi:predicted O-methyltransferase YrrM